MAVITKKALVNDIHSKGTGFDRKQIKMLIDAMIDVILDKTLLSDKSCVVKIKNLGSFSMKHTPAKAGVIKMRGQEKAYVTPACSTLHFSYDRKFTQAVLDIKNNQSAHLKPCDHQLSIEIKKRTPDSFILDVDDVSSVLNIFTCLLAKHLANENELVLRGLGRFYSVFKYDQRTRNPKTGESITKDVVMYLRFKRAIKAVVTHE
ncbi:TPA: HU family DNA-binding protein [Vibrio parahaemolyticus]